MSLPVLKKNTLLAAGAALALSLWLAGAAAGQEAGPAVEVAWRQELPYLTARPELRDGLVYAFSGNDVRALDAATGAPVWSVEPPPPRGRALLLGCCQAGAQPTEAGLYTLAGGNAVRALEPATGSLRWERALGDAILAPPVGAGEVVAILTLEGDEIRLYGLDRVTGLVRWQARPGPVAPLLGLVEGALFVALGRGGTAAYDAADGRLLWTAAPDRRPAAVSRRHVAGDVVVLPTEDGLAAFDHSTGAPRWATPLPSMPLEPLVLGGSVYARTIDGTVVALDAWDGRERWRADVGAFGNFALAGPAGRRLFAAGTTGLVALDAATGAELWRWAGERVYAAPLAADGALYVGTLAGDLLVLDPATGAERGRLALGAPVLGELSAAPNGLLLVPAENEQHSILVALRRPGAAWANGALRDVPQ